MAIRLISLSPVKCLQPTSKCRLTKTCICAMVVLTIFNTQILKGSEALPFRHDISTIVTVKEPLSPELAKHLKQKFKNFVDWYAVAVNQCKGAYKVKITPDLGIPEWESFNSLYLFVNETNDVRLIVERDRKFYIAPLSKPGLMTDRTLFLGPKNAGIHFLYQALKNELHTIVSPFSLQKHVSFKRINPITLSFYNDLKNLQEAPMPQDVNTSSVTNFMYYVEKQQVMIKKHF